MRPLIAGNWKMNLTLAEARALAGALRAAPPPAAEMLACPPHVALAAAGAVLAGGTVALGGQDCAAEANGAHTGDVSATMLRDAGATWVILGHSERRRDRGETDLLVRAKATAALSAGLRPIVCVGETEAERDAGQAHAVVARQLAGSLPDDYRGEIAYEPVWAIGTGRVPEPQDLIDMHATIRHALRERFEAAGDGMRILYGGSVTAGNAAALLGLPEVGGALVGGASLRAESFLAIAGAA